MNVNGTVATALWVGPGIQNFAEYPTNDKKELSKRLYKDDAEIDPCAVLVRQGYFPHAEGGWKRRYALQFQVYMIPGAAELKDGVVFPYGTSLRRKEKGVIMD